MKRLAPTLLLVMSVVASGCGTNAKADRQHFVARASSVCRHFSDLQNEVQFPSVNPVAAGTTHTERAEWAVALNRVAHLGTQEIEELRKIDPPGTLSARFDAFLVTTESAYAHLLAAADAAKRNHVARLRAAARAGRADLSRAARAAKAIGLRACA